jgi:glutamate--cysteine ligase
VAAAQAALAAPSTLPSARQLATIEADFDQRYTAFIRAQSAQTHMHMLALPWAREQQAKFEAMAQVSVRRQKALEAEDTMDFETFRQWYVAEEHLHV